MAQLLPKTRDELMRAHKGGVASLDLRRQPDATRQNQRMCVDCLSTRDRMTTTPRSVGAGTVVTTIPLVAMLRNEFDSSSSFLSCFGRDNSDLIFCGLTLLGRTAVGDANVELRWGGEKALLLEDIDNVRGGTGLTLELVATRDLAVGEHVVLPVDHLIDNAPLPIPEEMIPSLWHRPDARAVAWDFVGRTPKPITTFDGDLSDKYEYMLRQAPCGLYYGESTIPGAGYGTFVACSDELESGTVVSGYIATKVCAVRLCHLTVSRPKLGSSLSLVLQSDYVSESRVWVGYDYAWAPSMYGAEYESSPPVMMFSSDIGALSNSHPAMSNVNKLTTFAPLLDRRFDPGAGASTNFVASYVYRGSGEARGFGACTNPEELFVTYGDNWFSGRPQFYNVPLMPDYLDADKVAAAIWSFGAAFPTLREEISVSDILELVLVLDTTVGAKTSKLLSWVDAWGKLDQIREGQGIARMLLQEARKPPSDGDVHCLDNLFLAPSNIPQAGRGAFARRELKEGDVIVSSPMIAMVGKQLLDTATAENTTDINPTKMLLNYMFGHPSSSLLLLPTTIVSAINHGSGLSSPNARVEWSKWSLQGQYRIRQPPEELVHDKSASVFMDVVALRNIQVGEEILIDYGLEWEEAWRHHVR